MKRELKLEFENELKKGDEFLARREYENAFHHYELAHVLGQRAAIPHARSHLKMLIVGIRTKNIKEIFGQLLRIPLGVIGSLIGVVPTGNTGGANVGMFKRMEIPEELRKHLE